VRILPTWASVRARTSRWSMAGCNARPEVNRAYAIRVPLIMSSVFVSGCEVRFFNARVESGEGVANVLDGCYCFLNKLVAPGEQLSALCRLTVLWCGVCLDQASVTTREAFVEQDWLLEKSDGFRPSVGGQPALLQSVRDATGRSRLPHCE
jgi:hypothetical protein